MGITINVRKPEPGLLHLVDNFWRLHNPSGEEKDVVVLPDGKIDLLLLSSVHTPFQVVLRGLDAAYDQTTVAPQSTVFAISFNPLATEYLFESPVALLLNTGQLLPEGFWEFTRNDLDDFEKFCGKASRKIETLLAQQQIDARKQKLFELIFASNGNASVQELAAHVHWGSRQINRYFNQQFGLSLKTYCNIIRFRSSFEHLKKGKLFPEENFADQSHFIKQIKQFSGVSPGKLAQNKDDRFVQFSALPPK